MTYVLRPTPYRHTKRPNTELTGHLTVGVGSIRLKTGRTNVVHEGVHDAGVGQGHEQNGHDEQGQVQQHGVGTLQLDIRPQLPAGVGVVGQLLVLLEDGDGRHEDGGQDPADGDAAVGVREGLPRAGVQRPADGEVALQRDGHQREAAGPH